MSDDMDDLFDDEEVDCEEETNSSSSLFSITEELDKRMAGNKRERLLIFLGALTGYVDGEQQFVLVEGPTSAGKSFTVNNVIDTFIPQLDILPLSDGSPKALYYRKDQKSKKILKLSELQKLPLELMECIKGIHSRDGVTTRTVVDASTKDTFDQKVYPMSVVMTFAEVKFDVKHEQLLTRCILVDLPEDIKTNEDVVGFQARKYWYVNRYNPDFVFIQSVKDKVTAMKEHSTTRVLIPFFEHIQGMVDTTKVRSRSDIGKYMALISAMTLYNAPYRVKARIGDEPVIIATPLDAFQVMEAVGSLLDKTTKEISDTEYAILSCISKQEHTAKDIRDILEVEFKLSPTVAQIKRNLDKMIEKGYAESNKVIGSSVMMYGIAKEMDTKERIVVWKDVMKSSMDMVNEHMPDISEIYENTMKHDTRHPITGELVDLRTFNTMFETGCGVTPIHGVNNIKTPSIKTSVKDGKYTISGGTEEEQKKEAKKLMSKDIFDFEVK